MNRLTGNLTAWNGLTLFLILAYLGFFLIYPVTYVFKEAFWVEGTFTLQIVLGLFESPYQMGCIFNSFKVAVVATVLTLLVAMPLAHAFARYRFAGKSLMNMLVLVPLILPPFVGAIGMKQFFARFGSLNLFLDQAGLVPLSQGIDWMGGSGFWGVVIMQVLHLYPILFLNIAAVMANVDPTLREAAENMGAGGARIFMTVTLPLVMPGVFAGSVIVFIAAFTDLGTPLIFNYREVIPVQIFDKLTDAAVDPSGYGLIVIVLVMTLVLFVISKRIFGGGGHATLTKGHAHAQELPLTPWKAVLVYGGFGLVFFLSVIPHLSVVFFSFAERWFFTVFPTEWSTRFYAEVFTLPLSVGSIRNSLLYASLSASVDLVMGVSVAYLLTRREFPLKDWLDALVMLPLALPGLVLAFGYVMSFNWKIDWLNPRENPMLLLVMCYSVRRLPFIVRAAVAGFQQTSVSLEEASQNLGAGLLTTLRKITLPLVMANLIAGTILTFSYAMLEVSDSLILAMRQDYYPITKAIYQLMGRINAEAAPVACALGVVGMLILGLCLWGASMALGRKMGDLFRV
ncbi:MAG: iron ABC transporter permease [Verrucomicrobiae bacterium]|nr:iron ABC transporter permease [Verrucomicrobiae bacterium]